MLVVTYTQQRATSLVVLVTCSLTALVTIYILLGAVSRTNTSWNCQGGTVSVIAHADDDLLFQSPYIIDAIQEGCFTTVVASAGDAGKGLDYAKERERGNEAAHAEMVGSKDVWSAYTNSSISKSADWKS